MSVRHLTSIKDLSTRELKHLVNRAAWHKSQVRAGNFNAVGKPLAGQLLSMVFSKRSTRTRVSTEGAAKYLGLHPMFLGKDDIQLGVNESIYDTTKVLASMTSVVVARVNSHSEIEQFAQHSHVPVINALSDLYHPLQAIADLLTITEVFPSDSKLKVAWVGDANNVLHDLALACAKYGFDVSAATPKDHPVSPRILSEVQEAGQIDFALTSSPSEAVTNADIIVTDTWVSMGQEADKTLRLKQFEGYQVTMDLGARAKPHWKFMHCLPRKPEEVSDEVFYSDRSLVFEEAENRLYAAIAVLEAFVVQKGDF